VEVYTLPEYLELKDQGNVQIFDYRSNQDLERGKVNLTYNTFSFLLEGSKEVITRQRPVMIRNTDFLIMKSGHCLMTEKLSPSNKSYRSLLMFFSDELLFDFIRKQGIHTNRDVDAKPIEAVTYDPFLRSFVRSLEDLKSLSGSLRSKLLEVKFEEVMLYLLETQGEGFIHFLTANTNDQTRNLINVVESNSLNRLTLKELAFLCNMSLSTFKREFEKQFHESPSKWFQNRRLDHAAYLLNDLAKRPTDIYEEVGYESLSNFIHAFKVKHGLTPKQYQLER
jgi:AraC-like DNA-binding protein